MEQKVKTIKATTTIKETEYEIVTSFTEYDENGNELSHISYNNHGEFESKTTSKYNAQNLKIEEVNFSEENEEENRKEFIRNNDGLLIKEVISFIDGSKSIKNFERNGKKVIYTQTDDDGELEEKEELTYNENQLLIERIIYDYDNKIKERHYSTYNEKNKLVERKEFGKKDNDLINHRNYTYDENGNLLQELNLNRKGEIIDFRKYTYDQRNRVLESRIGRHNVTKYEYDDENKTITESMILPNGLPPLENISYFNESGHIIKEENQTRIINYEYNYF